MDDRRSNPVPAAAFRLMLLACLAFSVGNVLAAHVGASRCHCPCSLACGGGVSCNCENHTQSCSRCYCGGATLAPDPVNSLAGIDDLIVQGSFSSWFGFKPYSVISAGLEATMMDTGETETWKLTLVPEQPGSLTYVTDAAFDRDAYRAWRERIDRTKPMSIYAAVSDDPATYRILDGDLRHLNHSLAKNFELVGPDGSRMQIFRSDSTLGWEMVSYLRETVGGLQDQAFRGDADAVRGNMYSMIDTIDLQLNASDFTGATATVDRLIKRAQRDWLDASDPDSAGAVCAFRKMSNLLVPGSLCR